MSILQGKKKSSLLLSNWKAFKRGLINARMQEYYSKPTIRNISYENTQEVDWFEPLPEGGCLARFKEHRMPLRGLMLMDNFQAAYIYKRGITHFLQFIGGVNGFKKKNIFEKIFILISLLVNYEFYLRFIWNALYDNFLGVNKYSQPVRELYKIMAEFPMERDVACLFLEASQGYRYRVQDILSELDKDTFLKNPLKETLRLFDLMTDRETAVQMSTKWRIARKMITPAYWYLRIFKRNLLKKIIKIVERIDLNEIKLSPEDNYWCNRTDSYNFGGISWSIRKLLN